MVKSPVSCHSLQTFKEKRWPYDEYYFGDKDSEERKNGQGENHWTGAESLEWYTGSMVHDTMHGEGDYRWRHKDPNGAFVTYEGLFFANRLHGYGVMSYPDGRVFRGLFYNNVRWGPGEERTANLRANVGLWRGTQLARLNWRPGGYCVVPDLANGPGGAAYLDPYRIVLMKTTKIIGETNSALELLKHFGADPLKATEAWRKLYPKYCTDMDSTLCYKDLFNLLYYNKGKIHSLEETKNLDPEINNQENKGKDEANISFFAWNNNPMTLHMMKHSYKHDQQRGRVKIDMGKVLNGPRKKFRPAAKHEYDCRALLMASFLGNIDIVTKLVNEENVFPDLADSQGNTALMYSVCGDELDVIHFLIEAGAGVNNYNDSCCTPLGVALMRYLSTAKDIPFIYTAQVLLPPKEKTIRVENPSYEWYISRKSTQENLEDTNIYAQSMKKLVSTKSIAAKTPEVAGAKELLHDRDYDSDEDFYLYSDEKNFFLKVYGEYSPKNYRQFYTKPLNLYTVKIFTVKDMIKEIEAAEVEMVKGAIDKPSWNKKGASKATKGSIQSITSENAPKGSTSSKEKEKSENLSKILSTILQLLADGADPKLVNCPQPAILMATKAGSANLIQHLVAHGVDVNEKFPEFQDYTALDVIVSQPFTDDNVDLIRTLLEAGADPSHRLKCKESSTFSDQDLTLQVSDGPTLLHVVIARKADTEYEEQIRRKVMELLLKHNADPTIQFRGRSAIEYAMLKKFNLLNMFIENSSSYLNSIINQQQHTILVKLFSRDYFKTLLGIEKLPTLTNLLLFGADPLIECYDGDVRYENLFEFAYKTLNDIAPPPPEPKISLILTDTKGKTKNKGKALGRSTTGKSKMALPPEDTKKKDKGTILAEAPEYIEFLGMLKDCARLLHIRWLQAQLLKELIDVIYKFRQRHWSMIIKEHSNGHNVGLWVTASRCLEIWDILDSNNKRKYKEENILRKLLHIVQFYHMRVKARKSISAPVRAVENNIIQTDMKVLLQEHKMTSELTKEATVWKKPPCFVVVTPELAYKADHKFKICFECGLRLCEDKMTCEFCGLVSFCNINCLLKNSGRGTGDHPCSESLAEKYLPPPEDILL